MFEIRWSDTATLQYESLKDVAERAEKSRKAKGKKKAGRQEGLFQQVERAIFKLATNPRHPGLKTHEYSGPGLAQPYDPQGKLLEAYARNDTPGAYRVFWCYGEKKGEITIVAITPHPG